MVASKKVTNKIELNPEFERALDLMEHTARHIFVTGRAGTGKSTLLQYFRDHTKKNVVVLAPTGVAAVNIRGQTIHSFFGFKPDITIEKVRKLKIAGDKKKLYEALDTVVIDEISMVRADLLDCIDAFLRRHGPERSLPFGGVQMIMIGDLYQLPPVVSNDERQIFSKLYESPYFFSARVFSAQAQLIHDENTFTMELVELEKIYRQRDSVFIQLLNAIRNNTAGEQEFRLLNARHQPSFSPLPEQKYIHLTTTNQMAAERNVFELAKLSDEAFDFRGEIHGIFDKKYLPSDADLSLKIGAQVMMLNNDSEARWYNGSIGTVLSVEADVEGHRAVMVELADGEVVEVVPYRWDIYEFSLDGKSREIISEPVGSFTQFPMKLAWAVTIHKSQGKTFDRVVVDIGSGTFSPGQLYVALSRCTSLEGLILKRPIRQQHIWLDYRVVDFVTKFQYEKSNSALPLDDKISLIQNAIDQEEKLDIIYLTAHDVKSRRVIIPHEVGSMEFKGNEYVGVSAYCTEREADRIFRVDRILEINVVKS